MADYSTMNQEHKIHLNGFEIVITGKNVVPEARPDRFYINIAGEDILRVFKSYRSARAYAGKLVRHWPWIKVINHSSHETVCAK